MKADNSQANENIKTGLLVVGAVIGFKLVNDLIIKLGLGKGPGQTSVDLELANPKSPWKPAFWRTQTPGLPVSILTVDGKEMLASQIYNAFTVFNDNYDEVQGAIQQLKTQSQVSYLADYFQQKYGADMLTFLTGGGGMLPWDGLSDAHLKVLVDIVNNLPKYTP